MCGILGILSEPHRESRLSQQEVLAMRDCMATRGLAGSSLVQRKNLVLATRTDAQHQGSHFNQPAFSANGRFALACDAELFQLDALRDELARLGFHCRSDSGNEILLNAWLAWEKSFVRKLHGSFAIAVVDLIENRCWLIRDRCGAKPLFYANLEQTFVFASSIKSITRHPDFSSQPNFSAIRHYLATLRLTFDNQTLLKSVHSVLPAEMVCIKSGQVQRDIYWTPDQPTIPQYNYRETVDELNDQLTGAIGQHVDRLPASGKLGLLLRDGIDSSLLGSIAANKIKQPLVSRCGGIGSDEGDLESLEADFDCTNRFARDLKFDHQSVLVRPQAFLDTWQQLIGEFGSPLVSPHEVLLYQLARSIKSDASAVLVADGADELFCGYNVPHWAGRDFENAQTFSKVQSLEAQQTRESLRRQYGRDQFYSPADHFLLTSGLIPRNSLSCIMRSEHWKETDDERSLERYYDKLFAEQGDRPMAEKWAYVLFRVNLESVLSRTDRATAQAGVQVRSPFTDHRLVEFAFRLPHHFKIDLAPQETQPWLSSMELDQRQTIRSKRVLRSAAANWIPGDYMTRPKQSPSAAVMKHLATDWQPWISQTLRESHFFNEVFHESTVDEMEKLPEALALWNWPILNLALWGDSVF
jgi:asparagine synthase (glutamine-hydrolysing)